MRCEGESCFGASQEYLQDVTFVGLNGFYVVALFFELEKQSDLQELEEKGIQFCNQEWKDVQNAKGDVVQLETYCFR